MSGDARESKKPALRVIEGGGERVAAAYSAADARSHSLTNANTSTATGISRQIASQRIAPYAELHCLSDFSFGRGASSAGELFERAKQQGAVRPDLAQSDVIFMQVALSAIMDSSRAVAPDLYRRYLAIFLDGIRADRNGEFLPLPAGPLTAKETHLAMTRRRQSGTG